MPSPAALSDFSVLGLVGTTFVISAAYFQSYLVQQKGWDVEQLREACSTPAWAPSSWP